MAFYIESGIEVLGMLLGLAMGAALLGGLIYWQIREYQRWTYSKRLFLLLKLGLPGVIGVMMLAVMTVASGISGMEALGVFYLGIFVVMIAAPVATAALSPLFGIPFKQAVNITASLLATLLGFWFGGAFLLNTGLSLVNTNWSYKKERFDRENAELTAAQADGQIVNAQSAWRTLPDGATLLHTRYHIAEGWRVAKLQEQTSGNDRFVTSHGFCVDDALNLYTVIRDNSAVSFRVLVTDPVSGEYRKHEQQFVQPPSAPYLQLFHHNGTYAMALPLQANRVELIKDDRYQKFAQVVPVNQVSEQSYEANPCTPTEFFTTPFDRMSLNVYVIGLGGHSRFDFIPRDVAPRFRPQL